MVLPPLSAKIQTLLFIAGRSFTSAKLADLLQAPETAVHAALETLRTALVQDQHGLRLVSNNRQWELATRPEYADIVSAFTQAELQGELTRPQLETLTVIVYRGPITKTELEAIRGVHCGLILRNLAMRGLIEAEQDATLSITRWRVTLPFLRELGVTRPEELPDFAALHGNEIIDRLIQRDAGPSRTPASQHSTP